MSGALAGCLIAAYLLGSVPFSHLIARLRGVDLRTVGSGNVGATNLTRSLGFGLGVLGFLLDAGKGALAVLLPRMALPGAEVTPGVQALAGALAVVGHSFSPFLHFKGGKGVATGAGVFAVLAPLSALTSASVFALVLALTRIVGLASILGALTLPLATLFFGADRAIVVAAFLVALLVIARHRSNISRLLGGAERRIDAPEGR